MRSRLILCAAVLIAAGCNSAKLVSVASDGTQANDNSGTFSVAVSANGRFVAFDTSATNLDDAGIRGLFVHDVITGETLRVTVAADGTPDDGGDSLDISGDGRFVVFRSRSDGLVPGDVNGERDVFVRDMLTGQTEQVNLDAEGERIPVGAFVVAISADGRFVVFCAGPRVVRKDRATGEVAFVDVSLAGDVPDGASQTPAISPGGRFVAFLSNATDLVVDDENGFRDVFVRDMLEGTTQRVSVSSDGAEGNDVSAVVSQRAIAVSAEGRFVTYQSRASNLVPADNNNRSDVFVHDRLTGVTERVSVSSTAEGGNEESGFAGISISADGRYVVFDSEATNLISAEEFTGQNIYLHDRATGATRAVDNPAVAGFEGLSARPDMSADARVIAYGSGSTNLVPDDDNIFADIFAYFRVED